MVANTGTSAGEDVSLVAGGNLSTRSIVAAGNVNLTATSGGLLQHSNILADGTVAASAAGDITMQSGTATESGGGVTYVAGQNLAVERIGTAGDVVLKASSGSIAQRGDIQANGSVTANAGGDIVMAAHTETEANEDVSLVAGGNLSTRSIVAAGNVNLAATSGELLQHGNILAGKTVAASAAGDITMQAGTATAAGEGVTYLAGQNLTVERIETSGDTVLTASNGAVTAAVGVTNVQAKGLTATAASGIGQLASALKTRVDNLVLRITGAGDVHVNEADGVLVAADSRQGDIFLNVGGDIRAQDVVARSGNVSLDASGRVSTEGQSRIGANQLNVKAVDGVTIRTAVNGANVAVSGNGNLQIDEADAIRLERLTTANGNVSVSSGGRMLVDTIAAGAGRDVSLSSAADIVGSRSVQTPANAITGNRVTLSAANGIGQTGALDIAANRLNLSSTTGDIRINQVGGVALDNVAAGNGNVDINVVQGNAVLGSVSANGNVGLTAKDGSLQDDGSATTRIAARALELDAAKGIGNGAALQTRADTLVARVREAGAIRIDELDGLESLTASTAAGDIVVRSEGGNIGVNSVEAAGYSVRLATPGGAIRDARNDARNNITADNLVLSAARGVGQPSNALDVTVKQLTADGGNGGVYINSLSSQLLRLVALQPGGASLSATGGDIVLNAAGPLAVNDRVANTGGGSIVLRSTGDLAQNSDVRASGNGNVSLQSDAAVVMGKGVTTATGNGTVSYTAAQSLAISQIETGNTRGGGRVVFTAPEIIDNMPGVNNVKAWVVDVASPRADKALITELVGETQDAALVRLNYKPVGGNLLDSRRFMDDLLQNVIVQKQDAASRALMDVGMLNRGPMKAEAGFVRAADGDWEFNK